ncbi:hypothetical protein CEUSTIGMA_g2549.t1 [Chlamydomonas eustigma]|uniref:Major facilitator superfamily (MFS) profile domain-containing protein n=1 Tax=Chlamydomonas eustigma TaxID=1157962 RepID=A0A250WWD8_9CHLO|nr:hypothetical protein CEUSTIGMA_g2549.t1 [Chlamydomonas eustigma]|eukprot:GAX75105.1 hypothetical protein CEUSTIGMA_g2549.t1 [Chlamydomonas eustigma]
MLSSMMRKHAHHGSRVFKEIRIHNGLLTNVHYQKSAKEEKDGIALIHEHVLPSTAHHLPSNRHTVISRSAASSSSTSSSEEPSLGPVMLSVGAACAGALAFGFHLGVVNGPLDAISASLGVAGDAALQGLIVSSTLAGAAAGSLTGGSLSDTLGRRKCLLLAAFPMLVGPLLSFSAASLSAMVLGRFVTGVAIGVSSALVPTYISEIAPTSIRGTLGTLNQLLGCLGILAALAVNVILPVTEWRTMFLLGTIPAVALGLGMLVSPESPRWLLSNKQPKEAAEAAAKLWGSKAEAELGANTGGNKEAAPEADISFTQMLPMRSFQIGLLLFVFQQFAGINALVYFSSSVFRQAGVASDTLASLAVGTVNVLGTLVAASIIERSGRTTLLKNSYLGQGLAMFFMAAGFSLPALQAYSAPVAVGGTLLYILSFALGAGPITALIIPELNPAKMRGRAVSAAFVCHWICNVALGQSFMLGVKTFGLSAVYGFFGAVALGGALYVHTQVPETKGKSFDQIQKELTA